MLPVSPLTEIEPRLRSFLPAELYASAWMDPSSATLEHVFDHLRTLQRILYAYSSHRVIENPPEPGKYRFEWSKGTLMFTDMAGFTKLMEAYANKGQDGAVLLLGELNKYFTEMIETISKSGGDLLEFTGDALLVLFPEDPKQNDINRAIKAGLRMQRAMKSFTSIPTPLGPLPLAMRVGIHSGRFLMADIGTPRRMEHVLLGRSVQQAKLAESKGQNGRVNLSEAAYARARDVYRCEEGNPGYMLVKDDLSDEELGEYELPPTRKKVASSVLFDRNQGAMVADITETIKSLEPLACMIPNPIFSLLVECAADRYIAPDFPSPTVVFVNFIGLPELVDTALPGEETKVVNSFSKAFAAINAAVEKRGGVLKKVTYHLSGSDIVIYFGVPTAHTNDPLRAALAAIAIRDVVANLKPPTVGNITPQITCQIGINMGPAFVAEIGEKRGRREYNVLGDTVNTAARLMNRAEAGQILLSKSVHTAIRSQFKFDFLGEVSLKGKAAPTQIFSLLGLLDPDADPGKTQL